MASFGEQIQAAKEAHHAASALEDAARAKISALFEDWDAGTLTAQTVRHQLEAVVRATYRSSAAVAAQLAARQSGLPGWTPSAEIFVTDYLTALLTDIRRNLRDYKASARTDSDRRRAVLRMQHGAGVAAQRGYTDALIASYIELEDFGYRVRKLWLANFVNNTPCEDCRKLHGSEAGLRDEFPSPTQRATKIYHNLLGPPRHPRCRCYLVILIVSLENSLEELQLDNPTPAPESMSTDDVKRMPKSIFSAVVSLLRKIVSFVKRGSSGK